MGWKDVSSRAVSRDSQRLRHWTPDEPVKDLLMKVDRRLPSCSSSCLFHEADRRQTQPSLTQPVATPTRRFSCLFHEADRSSTLRKLLSRFPGARLSRSRLQTHTAASSHPADRRLTASSPFLAFLGARSYGPPPGTRDWSIARDCSSPRPIGCRHPSPTDTLGALGGEWFRGGKEEEETASRHTTTV